MWQCYYCRAVHSFDVQEKNRLCPSCGSDIHCCRNCHHFDESLSSKCHEPNSPWLRDRATQNSCPFFEFRVASPEGHSLAQTAEMTSEAERAKEAFRALFRNA